MLAVALIVTAEGRPARYALALSLWLAWTVMVTSIRFAFWTGLAADSPSFSGGRSARGGPGGPRAGFMMTLGVLNQAD